MSGELRPSVGRRIGRGILRGFFLILAALLIFFFLIILTGGQSAFLVEIPFHFICGWALHGWKALPPFLGKWESAILPAGCMIVAGVLVHRFIRSWAGEKRPLLEWRAKHTAAVMSLLFLCSAAAIATSGIVHQFFWLAGGKVIESNRRTDLVVAMNNGRQLMLVLMDFYQEKGRYPDSFEELEQEFGEGMDLRRLWWVESGDAKVPEPFVLLRPGSSEIALDEDALIASPLMRDGRVRVLVFGDTSVRQVIAKRFSDEHRRKEMEPGTDE